MAIDDSKNVYHTYEKSPKGRVATFPDFIPAGKENEHPGMGNGGRGADFLPAGKNCFDEWVGEPLAIAEPKRKPGRPRKIKFLHSERASAVAEEAEEVEEDDETEEVEDGAPDE